MARFWIGLVACLVLQQQGVLTYLTQYCGNSFPRPALRIYNGETAVMGTAPFMAFLYLNTGFHGSGSIITDRYILTAGHCLKEGLKVRLGEYDTRTNPDCDFKYCYPSIQVYEIEKSILHKGYNDDTLANDIALLKLRTKIVFNFNFQPVCLVESVKLVPAINEIRAFGWGLMANGTIADVLQTTILSIYTKKDCNLRLNDTLSNYQFCAGSHRSDTCSGDSGGPVVTQVLVNGKFIYVQLGIVSYGADRCRGVGVYTKVTSYYHWIQNKIESEEENEKPKQ